MWEERSGISGFLSPPKSSVPHLRAFFLARGWETTKLRPSCLSSPRCPSVFYFNWSYLSQTPSPETRPWPIFRLGAQTTLDRVPVDVAKLGHESGVIPDVVVEISRLPERVISDGTLPFFPGLD